MRAPPCWDRSVHTSSFTPTPPASSPDTLLHSHAPCFTPTPPLIQALTDMESYLQQQASGEGAAGAGRPGGAGGSGGGGWVAVVKKKKGKGQGPSDVALETTQALLCRIRFRRFYNQVRVVGVVDGAWCGAHWLVWIGRRWMCG